MTLFPSRSRTKLIWVIIVLGRVRAPGYSMDPWSMGRAVLQNTRELFLKLLRIPQIDQKQHDLLLLQHGHLPGICLIFQARRYDLKHVF